MRLQPIGLVLLLAAAIAFPLVVTNGFVTNIAFYTVIFAIAATSWNIFAGYTGYIALGHAVFFGTGAYALALMCEHWNVPAGFQPFWLLPLCGVIASLVAVPVGAIALRARGHTFVVITIAIFFIFQLMAYNLRNITQGSAGLSLPLVLWSAQDFNLRFIYAGLVILVLAFATSWFIRNSKYGLGLLAIRDDEDRARGLGVKTGPSKLVAFVISAFFVGMAGGLWAYFNESISPPFAFDALFDVAVALMTFMGGAGTLMGPLLGAVILEPAQLYVAFLVQQTPNTDALARLQYGLNLVIYGGLFLVILLLLPEGIIPTVRKRWIAFRAGRPIAPTAPRAAPAVAGAAADGPQQVPGDGEGPVP